MNKKASKSTMKNKEYIKKILEKLKPLNPYKIILFGSHAYGEAGENSDIDLLVVTDDDFIPQSFAEKMDIKLKVADRVEDIREYVPLDLLVFTRPMFEKFIELDSMFSREILKRGIALL